MHRLRLTRQLDEYHQFLVSKLVGVYYWGFSADQNCRAHGLICSLIFLQVP